MANPEHLAKLKEGVETWNNWRLRNLHVTPDLSEAKLSDTNLNEAKLFKANLSGAELIEANLIKADLTQADLTQADLSGADLFKANLIGAKLGDAKLHGARIVDARLQGAFFRRVEVDGSTLIWGCSIDRYRGEGIEYTDFEGVGLGDIRIDPPRRQLLEYNIRRANWNRWFQGKVFWFTPPLEGWRKWGRLIRTCPVRAFWELSDYGHSTKRIIIWFLVLAFVFAGVYYAWGALDYYVADYTKCPGIVENLFIIDGQCVNKWLVPLRAIYFSIVTMTTLGFGDLYATTGSLWRGFFGHLLLGIQVILGYVMLGALLTRFAVMFTGGGPAGKFAQTEKQPEM